MELNKKFLQNSDFILHSQKFWFYSSMVRHKHPHLEKSSGSSDVRGPQNMLPFLSLVFLRDGQANPSPTPAEKLPAGWPSTQFALHLWTLVLPSS